MRTPKIYSFQQTRWYKAAAALTRGQWVGKPNSSGEVAQSTNLATSYYVVLQDAASGEPVEVVIKGWAESTAAGTINDGDPVMSNSSGLTIAATGTGTAGGTMYLDGYNDTTTFTGTATSGQTIDVFVERRYIPS